MSMHGDHDLGHTVAGWTGTGTAVLGSTVMGVALAADSTGGLVAGGGIVVLAALVTWVLHLTGWGKASGPRPVERQPWRVRDLAARRGHPHCLGCRMAGRGRVGAPVGADPVVLAVHPAVPVVAPAASAERAPAAQRS